MKKFLIYIVTVVVFTTLTGCAALSMGFENFNRQWSGVSGDVKTYTSDGILIDKIHGTSFNLSRDTRFDSKDSDGSSNKDSSVLSISLGNKVINHVGSTLILSQDGLNNVIETTKTKVTTENNDPGVPWLNAFVENHRNMWQGGAKTIVVRSEFGTPVAVFIGQNVEIMSTSVPKSTQFRVDGKYLFVYRANYTVYDSEVFDS